MSQLETTPELNPTHLESHPTQQMLVKEPMIFIDLRSAPPQSLRGENSSFSVEQMDWVKIAQKNKYMHTYSWPVGSTVPWLEKEFRIEDILPLIPVGLKFNSYANFNAVLISIKPTNNAYFQGLTALCWDNAPSIQYYDNYLINVAASNARKFQFSKIMISPKDSGEINFLIPINFPFEFIKLFNPSLLSPSGPRNIAMARYFYRYSLGRLRTAVLSQLATTSTLTQLTFTMSGQVLDLHTAGLNIRSDTV